MLLNFYRTHCKSQQGFSVLEVLVTSAIIGIITAMVLFKYGSFNNVILLKSQAYEMALDIREAQTYAVSARGKDNIFREDYGLYFDTTTAAKRGQYLLFVDTNNTGPASYDTGEKVGVPYLLDARFEISGIRVNCVAGAANATDVSVSFKRPDFDAKFTSGSYGGTINSACIDITSVDGSADIRTVEVTPTGQIVVN